MQAVGRWSRYFFLNEVFFQSCFNYSQRHKQSQTRSRRAKFSVNSLKNVTIISNKVEFVPPTLSVLFLQVLNKQKRLLFHKEIALFQDIEIIFSIIKKTFSIAGNSYCLFGFDYDLLDFLGGWGGGGGARCWLFCFCCVFIFLFFFFCFFSLFSFLFVVVVVVLFICFYFCCFLFCCYLGGGVCCFFFRGGGAVAGIADSQLSPKYV